MSHISLFLCNTRHESSEVSDDRLQRSVMLSQWITINHCFNMVEGGKRQIYSSKEFILFIYLFLSSIKILLVCYVLKPKWKYLLQQYKRSKLWNAVQRDCQSPSPNHSIFPYFICELRQESTIFSSSSIWFAYNKCRRISWFFFASNY